jgi:predicted transcriptional regulator
MSTTTIRIDDELKARLAKAAEQSGKSSHGFILEAITRSVQETELNQEFHRIADERWEKILDRGQTIAWDDLRTYLSARAKGDKANKPKARKPAR